MLDFPQVNSHEVISRDKIHQHGCLSCLGPRSNEGLFPLGKIDTDGDWIVNSCLQKFSETISVEPSLQFRSVFVIRKLHFLRMGTEMVAKIFDQLLLCITEHCRILVVHRKICQIGQSGEHRHLRKPRDARNHEETDACRTILHLAVEIRKYATYLVSVIWLVQQTCHRCVIFINENDDAFTTVHGGKLFNGIAKVTGCRLLLIIRPASLDNAPPYFQFEKRFEFISRRCRGSHEIEAHHGIFLPLPISLRNGQPVKQFAPSFEDSLQCTDHQRLAKTARTRHKETRIDS